VSIKVLFLFMVLSSLAVIAVTVAAFVRIRWHLKSRRPPPATAPDEVGNHSQNDAAKRQK
jgi:hypothetical protein